MSEATPDDARLCQLLARARELKDTGGWLPPDQPDSVRRVIDLTTDLAGLIGDVVEVLRGELAQARAREAAARPVLDAAIAYGNSTEEPTDTPHEDALLDAVNAYEASTRPI